MQISRIFSRSDIERGLRSMDSRRSEKAFSGELYLTNRSASSKTDSIETYVFVTAGIFVFSSIRQVERKCSTCLNYHILPSGVTIFLFARSAAGVLKFGL